MIYLCIHAWFFKYFISEYEDIVESPRGYEKLNKATTEPPNLPQRNEVKRKYSERGERNVTGIPLCDEFLCETMEKKGLTSGKGIDNKKGDGQNARGRSDKKLAGGDENRIMSGEESDGYENPES